MDKKQKESNLKRIITEFEFDNFIFRLIQANNEDILELDQSTNELITTMNQKEIAKGYDTHIIKYYETNAGGVAFEVAKKNYGFQKK